MTVPAVLAAPLVLSVALGGVFVTNELSHGGVSEAVGLGHHHALDWDCAHGHVGPHGSHVHLHTDDAPPSGDGGGSAGEPCPHAHGDDGHLHGEAEVHDHG